MIRSILIAITLVLLGCKSEDAKIGNGSQRRTMKADYVVVEPRPIADKISVSGTLMPDESAMLSAQTSGQVREIYFSEGDRVEKGQLLVKLDDRQWLAQRQRLEAELETAQKDVERKEQLSEIQGVSQSELDNARLEVETIKANKEELDVMIEYASIRAPFSGIIGLRSVSPGSYLSAGAPVARLVKSDVLKLEFSVPEGQANKVKTGQLVRFSTSNSDSSLNAKVYATEPVINENTRALKVRAKVPNKDKRLIAGAFAEINLSLDSIPNALLVPTEALVPELNNQIVYIIKGGRIEKQRVRQGIRMPNLIQIEEGLSVGDTVMVSGLLQAKEGMPVKAGKRVELNTMEE